MLCIYAFIYIFVGQFSWVIFRGSFFVGRKIASKIAGVKAAFVLISIVPLINLQDLILDKNYAIEPIMSYAPP